MALVKLSTRDNPDIFEQASAAFKRRKSHLISEFIEGKSADFIESHTTILDAYFQESFEISQVGPKIGITRNPYAIIALGGYGRSEQCVHSDVDLLVLFEKKVPDETENLIREMVYPLWDMGLEVGHATRSIKECLTLAAKDFEVLTSLMDARFICGMSFLYSRLLDKIRSKILIHRTDKFIRRLIESNRARHDRFGDSSYLLEPNLKEGQGGLRDYHTILWIANVKKNIRQRRDLEYYGLLSHDEYNDLMDSLEFIWLVRNLLHLQTGKKTDQLYFEDQEKIADKLNYKTDGSQQPVERFLGDLHEKMDFIKQQHVLFVYELESSRKRRGRKKAPSRTDVLGLEVDKQMICFASSKCLPQSPLLLIRIFEESARLKIPLNIESRRLIRDFRYLADKTFRSSKEAVASFEKILMMPAPRFNVLSEMLNTGFLVAFIPQFEKITNRIQYDEYHLYPVDRHLLRTVRTVKALGTSVSPPDDPLCKKLYGEISDKKTLLWAALLHDIGKGEIGGGHSEKGVPIARDILLEKGYNAPFIDDVTFLIQYHLFLIHNATRRDIQNEETAIFCARTIQTADRLKMLYILTVADAMSTGPNAWNEWTLSLLRNLFLKVLNIIEKGELATREAIENVENKRERILASATAVKSVADPNMLFDMLSPRYLLYVPYEQILDHVRLYDQLGDKPFVWNIVEEPESETRTVTICAKDFPGLFSKIAGTFAVNGIDVLDARIFTWLNDIALDIFRVNPPPDQLFEAEKWEKARKDLEKVLSGSLDLSSALKEKRLVYGSPKPKVGSRGARVVIDNDTSSFFTIIEVYADDFLGLLFTITDAISGCELDIRVAKIATKVDQVVDVFYVRDLDGQKADTPDQVSRIQKALEAVLSGSK